MTELFAIAFLIIFTSMLIRTVAGFGSALIAIPLLSILFGAKYAIPFIFLYECPIDIMILGRDCLKVRVEARQAWPLLVSGLIGIPLGTEVLIRSDEELLKIVIGISLTIFSVLLLWNVNLRLKKDRFRSAAAGLLGGFLCGSIGMPGPPMALLLKQPGICKRRVQKAYSDLSYCSRFLYFCLFCLDRLD